MLETAFASSTNVPPENGWPAALYVSGFTLTTLGTGDIVPTTSLYRLLSITESAIGFGVFSMAIAYFLSVYGALVRRRTSADTLHHRTRGTGDAAVLLTGLVQRNDPHAAIAQLGTLGAFMQQTYETHRSYPVLRYFHADRPEQALPRLLLLSLDLVALMRSCLPAADFEQLLHCLEMDEASGAARQLLAELAPDADTGTLGPGRAGKGRCARGTTRRPPSWPVTASSWSQPAAKTPTATSRSAAVGTRSCGRSPAPCATRGRRWSRATVPVPAQRPGQVATGPLSPSAPVLLFLGRSGAGQLQSQVDVVPGGLASALPEMPPARGELASARTGRTSSRPARCSCSRRRTSSRTVVAANPHTTGAWSGSSPSGQTTDCRMTKVTHDQTHATIPSSRYRHAQPGVPHGQRPAVRTRGRRPEDPQQPRYPEGFVAVGPCTQDRGHRRACPC